MTDHIDQTLAQATDKLKAQEADVAQTKRFINQLLAFAGREPMYTDIDAPSASAQLRGDEYFGQKQQTAARLVLERRKALNLGPALLEEIFDAMKAGGYRHDARDDAMASKSLYNTLTQNTATFIKLPTGKFGLSAWYPNAPKKRTRTRLNPDEDSLGGPVSNGDGTDDAPRPEAGGSA